MIPPETVARIRDRADIAAVVGESVKLVRRGRALVGLCPFHKEKTPSLHVNPERGFFYCFGCHEKGDAIGFVMKTEGLGFTEAVRRLGERLGIEVEERAGDGAAAAERAARRAAQDLYDVSALAAAFFETQLREHPGARVAREELARRGLRAASPTDGVADALQSFRVGYAPAGWDGLASHLQRHGVSPAPAEAVGLLVPRKGSAGHYDRFRNRLMFAVSDVQGRVVAFSGRVLPDPESGQVDKETGKYVNSPESPIFRKGEVVFGLFQARQAIRQREAAVLVEGNFDVVSLHARGVRNVVAPLGTAFTPAQARLIKRFTQRVTVAFDADDAGRAAAKKAREPCREAGLDARVALLPAGKDPDELVRERGAEAFDKIVAAARPMLQYLVDAHLERAFSAQDAVEAGRVVQELTRLVNEAEDRAAREVASEYAKAALQSRLSIRSERLSREVAQVLARAAAVPSAAPELGGRRSGPGAASRSRAAEIPLEMLGCVLDCPEILLDPRAEPAIGLLEGQIALAVGLARNLLSDKRLAAESFLAQMPAPIHEFAARRLASPRHEDAGEALHEFVENARKLKRVSLSRQKATVVEQIGQAGAAGDTDREELLLKEAERKAREKLGL
jgi:DNA primase